MATGPYYCANVGIRILLEGGALCRIALGFLVVGLREVRVDCSPGPVTPSLGDLGSGRGHAKLGGGKLYIPDILSPVMASGKNWRRHDQTDRDSKRS